MFFSLTKQPKTNFFFHHRCGDINVFTDAGWRVETTPGLTMLYKGYADDFDLANNLERIVTAWEPCFTGNFCVIVHDHASGEIKIKTDIWRSFPIFLTEHEITNLTPADRVAWTDSLISVDQEFHITEKKFDVIGPIDTSTLPLDRAIGDIADILHNKTRNFLAHNQLDIKVHLSGGVDSMLVASLLWNNTKSYEIVKARHFDYDRFWVANDTQIRQSFWAYNQLHHWVEPCVLISGAPGDEFMLRSPVTIDRLLKYRGQSTVDLLASKTHSLHWDYFSQQKHRQIFQDQSVDLNLSPQEFYWQLCNTVVNDWQHWHLGNTLTWTPLRDLEIFKIMLRLSPMDAIDQIFDSRLSKLLIEQNSPGMSSMISDQKNSANPMKNLSDWLFNDV